MVHGPGCGRWSVVRGGLQIMVLRFMTWRSGIKVCLYESREVVLGGAREEGVGAVGRDSFDGVSRRTDRSPC